MGDDEWTVVSKGSRRKMSSTAFRALQVRAETDSGPAEDPPDASVDKTWSQIERAVREIRDAPFAKALVRRMEDAGFVPNARATSGEGNASSSPGRHAEDAETNSNSAVSVSGDAETTPHPRRRRMANAPRFSRMVILGLGSPTLSAVSRFQLALALVLAERFGLEEQDVDLYDPVFTRFDAETMRAKKVGTVIDRAAADAACGPDAAPARAPTFWYMPHCEVALYENVLRANGGGDDVMGGGDDSGGGDGADAAARQKKKRAPLALLGNRFETYELRWVGRRGAPECPTRVLEAAVAIAREGLEIEVDPEGTFTAAATLGAFNDTSVQAWGF